MTDLRNRWAAQEQDARFTDPEQLTMRSKSFRRTIRRRNLIEYTVAAGLVILFGSRGIDAWSDGQALRALGYAAACIGIAVAMLGLARRGSAGSAGPEESTLSHLRGELTRQVRALRSIAVWYLLPLVPGLILIFAADYQLQATLEGDQSALWSLAWKLVFFLVVFGGIWWVNQKTADHLEGELSGLEP
ncbi:hypothetical protein [Qipengyuania sp. JC766]|uniref:hypothetical protein n=1 Tax=Qipengyuania sp. JC766 TaxID=3232139 RepID=UPI00345983AC